MVFKKSGWRVDKKRIAYYTYGDKSKDCDIEDFVCEDALDFVLSELNRIKPQLANSVSKTDPVLRMAIVYFACCLVVKSGNATQTTGIIQSESLEGMSVSYGGDNGKSGIKTPIPKNWCEMAQDEIKRWASEHGHLTKNIQIAISNYRSKLFEGTFNKYTRRFDGR